MPFATLKIRPNYFNVLQISNQTIINLLSSVSCKLDTRIPNKFWPFFESQQKA